MEHSEKVFIDNMLSKLSENSFYFLSSKEYLQLGEDFKEKWLVEKTVNSKTCYLCFGKNCNIEFENKDKFLPCPHGATEIIEITEFDHSSYHFNLDLLFEKIKSGMDLKAKERKFNEFHILGQLEVKNSDWKVVFIFGRYLQSSLGNLIEFHLHNKSTFTLMFVDKMPRLNDFKLSVLLNLGIYLYEWKDYDKRIIDSIYQTKRAEWEVRKELDSLPFNNFQQRLLSTLEKAAKSGDGDWFEDEVYKTFRRISPHIVPFGAQYKGFSVPDGMIFGSNSFPFPTLFYDCKSSKTDDYASESGVAMQVNYYMDFLKHFHNQPNKYENHGFVIFAEEFNPKIKQKIAGSPQWKLVQEKYKLFYINRKCLDIIEHLIKSFGAHGRFKNEDIFNLCFGEDVTVLEDSQCQKNYEQLFPSSSLNKFRYLDPKQFEVAIIASILNHNIEVNMVDGTKDDIKEALRKAKHDNMKRGIKRPVLFPFIEEVIKIAKEDEEMTVFHPLTTLLILNRNETQLIELLGEEKVNTIAEKAEEKIDRLIEERR